MDGVGICQHQVRKFRLSEFFA